MNLFQKSILLSLLFIVLCTFGCESDSKENEPDLEKQRWMFLLFTNSSDPRTSCIQSMNGTLLCADNAGGGGAGGAALWNNYTTFITSIYSITIASPGGPAEICDALVQSENFPVPGGTDLKFSDGAKICFWDCEQLYWERVLNDGHCTAEEFPFLSIPENDAELKECRDLCLKQGTILP